MFYHRKMELSKREDIANIRREIKAKNQNIKKIMIKLIRRLKKIVSNKNEFISQQINNIIYKIENQMKQITDKSKEKASKVGG